MKSAGCQGKAALYLPCTYLRLVDSKYLPRLPPVITTSALCHHTYIIRHCVVPKPRSHAQNQFVSSIFGPVLLHKSSLTESTNIRNDWNVEVRLSLHPCMYRVPPIHCTIERGVLCDYSCTTAINVPYSMAPRDLGCSGDSILSSRLPSQFNFLTACRSPSARQNERRPPPAFRKVSPDYR